VSPAVVQATPGSVTATLLADLKTQGIDAAPLGEVKHPYLTGHGTMIGFAGDNLQIFEYPTSETARAEAEAISKRAPRLVKKSFFHVYLHENLIGLYFGHNEAVM